MSERVADAIFDVIWPTQDWDESSCRAVSEAAARAAIKTMREPTDMMDRAGLRENTIQGTAIWATPAWQAMIDAALAPTASSSAG